MQTLIEIYQGQYKSLVNYRLHLIAEIEKTNNEISAIIKAAKKESIDLVRISATE